MKPDELAALRRWVNEPGCYADLDKPIDGDAPFFSRTRRPTTVW